MIKSLVPGRILSMSSITAAVIGAYAIRTIQRISNRKNIIIKLALTAINIGLIVFVIYDMNPYKYTHAMMNYDEYYDEYMPNLQGEGDEFDKGRYEWIAPVNCAETYCSTIKYGYNTSDGWNIEGTPHNRTIWNYNIALTSGAEEYVVKDMLYWNVRSIFTLSERTKLLEALERYGFKFAAQQSEKYSRQGILYTSDAPSSYFLTDSRDCLVIGQSAGPVALEFPYMVNNVEMDITKLDKDELQRYKIIYIVDPILKTLSEIDKFEKLISDLIKCGTHIIIEPSLSQQLPICGVAAYDFKNDYDSRLIKQNNINFTSSVDNIKFGERQLLRGLIGLDEVYYKLISENDRVSNVIVGTKNFGGGKVYFIGKHLSQYMKSSNIFIYGYRKDYNFPYAESSKTLLNDIFDLKEHNKNFVPEPFNVEPSSWNYKGVNFTYETDEEKEILISVTHTPRWKIKIDGKKTNYRSRENLVALILPKGKHNVEMRYGISVLGLIGYIISFMGLMLLIIFFIFFNKVLVVFNNIGIALHKFLEFRGK